MSGSIPSLPPDSTPGRLENSIEYRSPGTDAQDRRPGLLTAAAILSLVIGLLALAANGYGIFRAVKVYAGIQPRGSVGAAPPLFQPAKPSLVPFRGDYVPQGGMSAAERAAILAAVEKSTALTPDRREILDWILAECGKSAFGSSSAAAVSHRPGLKNFPPEEVLTTANGVIAIGDDRACFHPSDGSGDVSIVGDVVTRNGGRFFTAGCIDRTILRTQQILQAAGPGMTSLQAGADAEQIRDELTWTAINSTYYRPQAMVEMVPNTGDVCKLTIEQRTVWIEPTGRVVGTAPATVGAPPAAPKAAEVDTAALGWSAAELAASMIAGVISIVAGIRVLQGLPSGPRAHGIYVLMKFPLAALAFALALSVVLPMNSNPAVSSGAVSAGWFGIAAGIAIQSGFAVALIFVYGNNRVRQYLAATGVDGGMFSTRQVSFVAGLAPDRWNRTLAVAGTAAGLVLVTAAAGRIRVGPVRVVWQQAAIVPALLLGLIMIAAGVKRLVRGRTAVLMASLILFASAVSTARADNPMVALSTDDLIRLVESTKDEQQRRSACAVLYHRPHAVLPLLKFIETENDTDLAGHVLFAVADGIPARAFLSPEERAELDKLLPALLDRSVQDQAGLYNQTLEKLYDRDQLLPTIRLWLTDKTKGELQQQRRGQALTMLDWFKPMTPEAARLYAGMIHDPQWSERVVPRLVAAGPDGEPQLIEIAKDKTHADCQAAAVAGLSGQDRNHPGHPVSYAASKALDEVMAHGDADLCLAAAKVELQYGVIDASGAIRPGDRLIAELLREAKVPRRDTVYMLQSVSLDKVVPAMVSLLGDPKVEVRRAAVDALERPEYRTMPYPVPPELIALGSQEPDQEICRSIVTHFLNMDSPSIGPNTRHRLSQIRIAGFDAGLGTEAVYREVDPVTGTTASKPPETAPGSSAIGGAVIDIAPLLVWPVGYLLLLAMIARRAGVRPTATCRT